MITLISCLSINHAIGYKGDLIYKIKSDMELFKEFTTTHTVIMGRNTFESLNCKPLSNRKNIVVSSTLKSDKVTVVKTLKEAIKLCKHDDIYIIGGSNIYKEGLEYATNMILNYVFDIPKNADTYFPAIDYSKWKIIFKDRYVEDIHNTMLVMYEKCKS